MTTKQVNSHIEDKDIVGIDEIIPDQSDPYASWFYIRDIAYFQEALSRQTSDLGIEDTKTQTTFSVSRTNELTGEVLDYSSLQSQLDQPYRKEKKQNFLYKGLLLVCLGVGVFFGFQKWQDLQESVTFKV